MNRSALACSRPECERSAEWQPIVCIPVVRSDERDVVHLVVPLAFCDAHRMSRGMTLKIRTSPVFQQALARRLGDGWLPETQRAWVERTRIVTDA